METPANLGREGGRRVQLSLLPEPPFSPVFPTSTSEQGHILSRLLRGDSFSQGDLLRESNGACSWRIASAIEVLRKLGWPIESIPTGRNKVVRYCLPKWVIAEVGGLRHG